MVAIFFRPVSPSFERRSRAGIAIVSSCMIMELLIYGVMPIANSEAYENAPPVSILI